MSRRQSARSLRRLSAFEKDAVTTATKGPKLDTAVILTTAGVFGRPVESGEGSIGPLTRVGGLSLFLRTVLTLQRAQFTKVMVLAGDELASLGRTLRDDPRVTVPLRWLPVREFSPDDARTWQALATEMQGACLVVGAQAVFARGLVERLRQELEEGHAGLVVRRRCEYDGRQADHRGMLNPLVQLQAGRLVALHDRPAHDLSPGGLTVDWQVAADMIVLPSALLATSGMAGETRERQAGVRSHHQSLRASGAGGRGGGRAAEREREDGPPGRLLRLSSHVVPPLRALLDQAAAAGRVRVLSASPDSPHWYHDVQGPAGPTLAERTLLQSLKGELEGYVDRHLNRKISGAFTRLFLRMGLSANAVTMISMVIGLSAAACIAAGSYAAGIVGALLFQLSAIVDCCDGEVARLTFTESSFGEHLDLAADNVVHVAIFGGVAWSVYLQQGSEAWPWLPLALGGAAVLANGLSLWMVLRARRLRDPGAWRSLDHAARSNFILKHVASRDFSVLLLVFAFVHHLDWFLWVLAIGSNVFWIMMAWMTRPSLQARG